MRSATPLEPAERGSFFQPAQTERMYSSRSTIHYYWCGMVRPPGDGARQSYSYNHQSLLLLII
eukprot:scaffold546_cov163-Amphora_coffeaeformis.AAC.4